TYRILQLAVAVGMAFLVRRVHRRGGSPRGGAALAFPLGGIWMTAFRPAREGPTYTLPAPRAAFLFVATHADGGIGRFSLALLGFGLLASPIVRDAFPHGSGYRALGPFPAGGLVLLLVVVWDAMRQPVEAVESIFAARVTLTDSTDELATERRQ